MKYQKIVQSFEPFSFFNVVNYYLPLFKTKFLSLLYFKKKVNLKNSFKTDNLLTKIFGKDFHFERLRTFFFDTNVFAYSNLNEKGDIISYLKQNHQNETNQYIEIADRIVSKEFNIFGNNISFKGKIDWFYGFDDDFRWSSNKSDNIDIRPVHNLHNVDVKYVWELNRHQFLPYLGFAYYITGDDKYSKAFKELVLDWIQKNPPLNGANWISGLEISIRLISWIFSLYFFKDSKEVNNDLFFPKIMRSMIHHAYFLRYFYIKRSFNHTIGDIFGVYLFSKIFEQYRVCKKWEIRFYKLLKCQISLQVRPDGVNIEQSIRYHKFVLEFFSLFLILNPKLIKEPEGMLIEKMYNYLLQSIKPNCQFPLIGNNDDGKVLLLAMEENQKYFDLLSLGVITFENEELKFIIRKISPIIVLLLGKKGIHTFTQLNSAEPKEKVVYFANSGYFIARNDWKRDSNYIFVDFGRFGPQNAPHSHSDITNFIYSYKGKDIIIDSGNFTYNKSWDERNYFRSSKAHNIVAIDGGNQAHITNWFGWDKKPKIKRRVNIEESSINLQCTHDGYDGFLVERRININKNVNEIIIQDKIISSHKTSGKIRHDINLYFHFAKDLSLKIVKNSVQIDNDLVFQVSSSQEFDMRLEKSSYSPGYGRKLENFLLNVHINHDFEQQNPLQIISKLSIIKN